MIKKDTEYSALKQEILDLINIQNNYIIAMYTITITILGIAMERKNATLFLLPYIVLFSFQRIIAAKRDGYLRIAAYIAVYLEEGEGWESNYKNTINQISVTKKKRKKTVIENIISGRLSSLQLGLLCSLLSIGFSFKYEDIEAGKIIILGFAVVLFGLLYYFNKDILQNMDKRESYINSLKEQKK